MIHSLGRLATFCLQLLSTVCNLVISFGCQSTTASGAATASTTTTTTTTMVPRPNPHGPVAVANGVGHNESKLPASTTPSNSPANNKCTFKQNGFLKANGSVDKQTTTTTTTTPQTKVYTNGCANGVAAAANNSDQSVQPKKCSHDDIALYPHLDNNFLVRPKVPFLMKLSNYLTHGTLILFGYLNDFLRHWGLLVTWEKIEHDRKGYSQLYSNFATFYIRNIIQRLIDMWCHPICSVPGAVIDILERSYGPYNATWKYTGRKLKAINMGSYNYLGFAENSGARVDSIIESIRTHGVGTCSVPNELGTYEKFRTLEQRVAQFLAVEDSVVFGMGFATNASGLPCLFGPGCLVISDQCNHASLVLGCKLSGAKVKVFKHNNMVHLEKVLRTSIVEGQPDGQPWRKVVILIEGIYSMEGTIVNLPQVIRLKRRYKAYLYMDEAHSIGAMGPRGRGICDYYGCSATDVDIFMGTFTKSFAAAGGYIAGSRRIINYIRSQSPSLYYGNTMGIPVVEQISYILNEFLQMDKNNNHLTERYYDNYFHLTKLGHGDKGNKANGVITWESVTRPAPLNLEQTTDLTSDMSHDVQHRIIQLRKNARYFRQSLKEMGFHVDGHDDSPVVPIMVYSPTLLKCLISELLQRGVASTGAAFPVTSLIGIRARFCLSASHTDEMIDYTLQCLDEIGDKIGIKFDKPAAGSKRAKVVASESKPRPLNGHHNHHHHHHHLHHHQSTKQQPCLVEELMMLMSSGNPVNASTK